jgi:hypothetical protein
MDIMGNLAKRAARLFGIKTPLKKATLPEVIGGVGDAAAAKAFGKSIHTARYWRLKRRFPDAIDIPKIIQESARMGYELDYWGIFGEGVKPVLNPVGRPRLPRDPKKRRKMLAAKG